MRELFGILKLGFSWGLCAFIPQKINFLLFFVILCEGKVSKGFLYFWVYVKKSVTTLRKSENNSQRITDIFITHCNTYTNYLFIDSINV